MNANQKLGIKRYDKYYKNKFSKLLRNWENWEKVIFKKITDISKCISIYKINKNILL